MQVEVTKRDEVLERMIGAHRQAYNHAREKVHRRHSRARGAEGWAGRYHAGKGLPRYCRAALLEAGVFVFETGECAQDEDQNQAEADRLFSDEKVTTDTAICHEDLTRCMYVCGTYYLQ